MKLTDSAIRAMRPGTRPFKRFDGDGLYLLVKPSGAKLWRIKYRFEGREKLLALGEYPEVTLRRARERRFEARQALADGRDPSQERKREKATVGVTFEAVAKEWLGKQDHLSPETRDRIQTRLARWVYPKIGKHPIGKIGPPDVLAALQVIENRSRDTAHRVRADVSRVMRHAVATLRAERDITYELRGALAPVRNNHFAAITSPNEAGALLHAIDGYRGQPSTEFALKIAPHVFLRPNELRGGRWTEIDFKAKEWRIPADRMKRVKGKSKAHVVPLSKQVVVLLEQLHAITGRGDFMFPSMPDPARPISDNTLNVAIRRMGFTAEQHTAHGFRSMASSLLNELGEPADVIELQLAHQPADIVRATYNRSERMEERRKMMQRWSDYLDELRAKVPQ